MIALLAFAALVGPAQEAGDAILALNGAVLAGQIARGSPSDDTIVLQLPPGVAEVELSEAKRRELLRAVFPGGANVLAQSGPVRVLRKTLEGAPPATRTCFAAGWDITEGTLVQPSDLSRVECRREAPGDWLAYDPDTRSIHARRDVAAGAYLGSVRVAGPRVTQAGAHLVFRTTEGPVTIERKVVALQSARAGHRVFARTDDGAVLELTLEPEAGR